MDSFDQAISIVVRFSELPEEMIVSVVHGSNSKRDRRILWDRLLQVQSSTRLPCLCGGDFNAISKLEERKGGRSLDTSALHDFFNFQVASGILELPFSGNPFTWFNLQKGTDRQWSRLDRIFSDHRWHQMAGASEVAHLNQAESDHAPLLLSISSNQIWGHKAFRFLSFWTSHPSFLSVVSAAWSSVYHPNGLVLLGIRLAATRKALSRWSFDTYGDIFEAAKKAEAEVLAAEAAFDASDDPHSRALLNAAITALKQREAVEWSGSSTDSGRGVVLRQIRAPEVHLRHQDRPHSLGG